MAGHGAPSIDFGGPRAPRRELSGLQTPAQPSLADAMNGAPAPAAGAGAGGGESLMEPGTLRPGTFDPLSGSFATSHGIPQDQRYVPLDANRYVDIGANTGLTRAMMQAEERARAAEVSADARVTAASLGAGSRTAVADTNAGSRRDVAGINAGSRASVAAGNNAAKLQQIERQAKLAGDNAAAHDTRVATRTANGRTPAQQQAWAKSMADGIIQMHDGDLSAAEDFLSNDERGVGYSAQGLTANDLYAAAGRYRGVESKAATGVMSSGMAGTGDEAVQKVEGARPKPTPGSAPRPVQKPPAAAAGGGATAADEPTITTVLARIRAGKATAADVEASPSLSPAVKAAVKARLAAGGQ